MAKDKVLISDSLSESGKAYLSQYVEVVDRPGITPEELVDEIKEYQALIIRGRTKVTKDVINAGVNLKVVGRAGVGVDNIDLAAAQAQGVTVVNSPNATTNAVAEHAIALVMALLRNVSKADASMKSGLWEKKTLAGMELDGKTVGVIGLGRIGSRFSQLVQAFGATVIGFDPLLKESDFKERNIEPVSLEQLLQRAEIISLHIPLIPETRDLMNDEAFGKVKRGVLLVNTSRGGTINETALLSALESGQVAGAALDVFGTEPPGLTALVAHPNVIATPHIAAQTAEAQVRAADQIAEEVLRVLQGKDLRWKVV